MVQQNKYNSYNIKDLPQGCQYCVKGEKLVLFVTGLCPRKCYFCPVSDEKYGKDVVFANERKVVTSADVLEEAELMRAKGAGITGGDPLAKIDRTVRFIKVLKEKFGQQFHVHLYTSLRLVNEDALQKLYQVGLDEIRFHPDLDSEQFWNKIELAKKFPWDIGIEIPLIPNKEKEIKKMIDLIHDQVNFLNLNELEVADNQQSKLLEMGFETKDKFSYAIAGSLELGLVLLDYAQKKNDQLRLHLCTAKLKDSVQLANRIKRESKNAKHDFDHVDDEGLLTRGALYLDDLKPDFGYRQKLKEADLDKFVAKLILLSEKIKKELKLSDKDLFLDEKKPRLILSRKNVQKHKKYFFDLGLKPAIVKEYPTADQLEIEVQFLN